MRNTLLLIGIICSTIGSLFAVDANPVNTNIVEKVITVNFDQATNAPVDVILKDMEGHILIEEALNSQDAQRRKYNLKNLPSGKYTLEVYEDFKVTKQTVRIDGKTAILTDEIITFKPVCSQTDNHWSINLLLLEKDADIEIYDAQSNLVYTKEYKGQNKITKSFDLTQLKPGTYNAIINIEGEVFKEPVFVR